MFWFKIVSKIIKILNSNATPRQIGWGFSLGALVGLMPISSPQSFLGLLVILLLNVQMGMAFIAIGLFKIVALLLDTPAHFIGSYLLVDIPSLKGLWTSLYNMPVVPFTKFNNTVVMGNLIIGIIIFIPLAILVKIGVVYYRTHLMEKVQKFKIMKLLKGSKLYGLYKKALLFKN